MLNLLRTKKARIIAVVLILTISFTAIAASFIVSKQIKEGPYIRVGTHDVSRIEYEFYKNLYVSTFETQYSDYLEALGIDKTKEYKDQQCLMYEDLTWNEYFEGRAIDVLQETYILEDDIKETGYEFDTDQLYSEFIEQTSRNAFESSVSLDEYLSIHYAEGANKRNFKDVYSRYILIGKYREEKKKNLIPDDATLNKYYTDNKQKFDLVNFRDFIIGASTTSANGETVSEETAMNTAKEQAESMFAKIYNQETFLDVCAENGASSRDYYKTSTLYENIDYDNCPPAIVSWLFDEKRENNAIAVIEDKTNKEYHLVFFINREKNILPTVNFRNILIKDSIAGATSDEAVTSAKNKIKEIIEDYEKTNKTEENFADLAKKYSEDTDSATNGGLYSEILASSITQDSAKWLFDSIRTSGDYTTIYAPGSGAYALYYVGRGDPAWKVSARNEIVENSYNEFIDKKRSEYTATDLRGEVDYLKLATPDQIISK